MTGDLPSVICSPAKVYLQAGVVVGGTVVTGALVVGAFGSALVGIILQLTPLRTLKSSIAMSPV